MGRGKRWLLSLAVAGAMISTAACDAIGGVDVNEAIAESAVALSVEGTMRLEWELTPSAAADQETKEIAAVFGSGEFIVSEMLTESAEKMSMSGELKLAGGSIPFDIYIDGTALVLDAEGLKQPYVIDLGESGGGAAVMPALPEGTEEAVQEAMKSALKFVLGHVSQPASTRIGTEKAVIDGAEKDLLSVEMDLTIPEAMEALAGALESVASDEEGLKALLDSLYDALKPVLGDMLNPEGDSVTQLILDNKSFAIDLLYMQISPVLQELAAGARAAADGDEIHLGESSRLTYELLFDGTKLAGVNAGILLEPPAGEDDGGIASLRINAESRWWNANGEVSAKTHAGAAVPFPLDASPRDRLNNVEPSSLLYDILRNQLHVTQESFSMYMGENAGVPDGVSPYIKGAGTTMVPVRYVSEQLHAHVVWDGEAGTVTITDAAAGVTIVLTVGETTATVNGEARALPEAPEIIHGSTFVPIKFIVTELGGTIHWDGEFGIVTITKEY